MAANVVMQQTFGEPVVYQPVQAGAAVGDPLTITAVRHARVREETGALANFEEISVNPPDLPNPPVKGDWVTAWGAQYTLTTVRQPASLFRRRAPTFCKAPLKKSTSWVFSARSRFS